jgi:hypothetical protein
MITCFINRHVFPRKGLRRCYPRPIYSNSSLLVIVSFNSSRACVIFGFQIPRQGFSLGGLSVLGQRELMDEDMLDYDEDSLRLGPDLPSTNGLYPMVPYLRCTHGRRDRWR